MRNEVSCKANHRKIGKQEMRSFSYLDNYVSLIHWKKAESRPKLHKNVFEDEFDARFSYISPTEKSQQKDEKV